MSPWAQISPTHYQRQMGENEALIKFLGNRGQDASREHWSVSAAGTFQLSNSLSAERLKEKLQNAWAGLRFQHPSIAAVPHGETLNYFVPSLEELQQWIDETFLVLDGAVTADQVVENFGPSPYTTCYYLPHSSQIIIHTSHWRTDGYGILQLLGAFFNELSGKPIRESFPWGQEPQRLTVSIEEVLALPEEETTSPATKEEAARCLATGRLAIGALGVKYKGDADTKPAGTGAELLRISPATTKSVFDFCHDLDISPLSAVHAALAVVNQSFAPEDDQHKHYTSTIRLSLRPYLPEPYNTERHASALYTGGYFIKVEPSDPFIQIARQYDAEYRQGLNPEFIQARRQYASMALDVFKRPIQAPPRSDVDISSVGDAELLVKPVYQGISGDVNVLCLSLCVETLTRQMYLFYWTFQGRINFYLSYNKAYYDVGYVRQILHGLEKVLLEGLGIE